MESYVTRTYKFVNEKQAKQKYVTLVANFGVFKT